MATIEELINEYGNDGVSTPEVRKTQLFSFVNWARSVGYEFSVKLTRAEAERRYETAMAERVALDERIAELEKELQQ